MSNLHTSPKQVAHPLHNTAAMIGAFNLDSDDLERELGTGSWELFVINIFMLILVVGNFEEDRCCCCF